MIEILLRGQLGNWLFQYALGRRLSRAHGVPLVLNACRFERRRALRALTWLPRMTDAARVVARPQLRRRCARALGTAAYFEEHAWGFDPAFLAAPPHSTLRGYFQCEHYFGAPDELRGSLRDGLARGHAGEGARIADEIAQCESVCVHVRRGDYLTTDILSKCDVDYYSRAMDAVRVRVTRPVFFVFSDDLAWCRAQPVFRDARFVAVERAADNPLIDLDLMTRCKHHIIANSTYSWWGAWLASGTPSVVAPSAWFTDPSMNALALRDTIPSGWATC